ncbi:MAG: hypothetical protein IT270_15145 [Saprospiraceae bacterium]|nr:hypothetical protein [Saprospiraceae bacterium]
MKPFPTLFLVALTVLATAYACSQKPEVNCVQSLRQRDESLMARVDSIIQLEGTLLPEAVRADLESLREEEELLFRDARQCDFGDDITAYNYWHRGRLKFPGRIESELRKLAEGK